MCCGVTFIVILFLELCSLNNNGSIKSLSLFLFHHFSLSLLLVFFCSITILSVLVACLLFAFSVFVFYSSSILFILPSFMCPCCSCLLVLSAKTMLLTSACSVKIFHLLLQWQLQYCSGTVVVLCRSCYSTFVIQLCCVFLRLWVTNCIYCCCVYALTQRVREN